MFDVVADMLLAHPFAFPLPRDDVGGRRVLVVVLAVAAGLRLLLVQVLRLLAEVALRVLLQKLFCQNGAPHQL